MELAVSSWSLRSHVNKDFELFELPQLVADRFGVHALELCQMHFYQNLPQYGIILPGQDVRFLDQVIASVEAANSRVVNVPIDVGNLAQTDPKKRRHEMGVIKGWMDVAAYIGSECARVNTGRFEGEPDLNVIIDGYRELAEYGDSIGVKLVMENHWGVSSDPTQIGPIFEGVNHPNFASCPDLGNFPDEDREAGLQAIVKYTELVHAKTYDFNEDGVMTKFDFPAALDIVKQTGFDGVISVEFEGDGDQFEGVAKTIAMVKNLW